ncbi:MULTISPECIES: hypothetical protein [unclassified Mameliella]|uniref:CIS tube protein n=1 Tax=unclassified Mameliella TaxID=2630630 RepID=UPI00273FF54C|nr:MULTISPECIES: hypothetical protein [unclassified Mameliella]
MPEPQALLKAQIQPVTWDEQQTVSETGDPISVQFNPETLKVAYSNKSAGGDQRGGSAIQFVGSGTTKLTLDLWFDVTAPAPDRPESEGETVDDVRRLTQQVVRFIQPEPSDEEGKFTPPGIRFLWGTFLFEGVVDSINEELLLFSEDGKPLRAKIALALSKQEIQFQFGNQGGAGLGGTGRGSTPPTASQPAPATREGESVQEAAAREGRQDDWQDIARQNNIDNPRNLPAGTPLDLSRPGRR